MQENNPKRELTKLIRSLHFQTTQTLTPINDFEGKIVIRTKCNNLFFDDFEDTLYDLIDQLDDKLFLQLKTQFFNGDEYLGTIKRSKKALDPQIFDHMDVIGQSENAIEPEESFIKSINIALKNDQPKEKGNGKRLKCKTSARKLGYAISVLCDLDIIDAPTIAGEVNRQELAHQILGSFDVKAKHQALRKAVDVDKNPLSKNEKLDLFAQIENALRNFEE